MRRVNDVLLLISSDWRRFPSVAGVHYPIDFTSQATTLWTSLSLPTKNM